MGRCLYTGCIIISTRCLNTGCLFISRSSLLYTGCTIISTGCLNTGCIFIISSSLLYTGCASALLYTGCFPIQNPLQLVQSILQQEIFFIWGSDFEPHLRRNRPLWRLIVRTLRIVTLLIVDPTVNISNQFDVLGFVPSSDIAAVSEPFDIIDGNIGRGKVNIPVNVTMGSDPGHNEFVQIRIRGRLGGGNLSRM
uniref:Uncharacterized protein n=1 Tax=Cacopsylla melanoneura TaxID=428564 RepID=A0A8D8M7D1_9HEMI